MAPIVACIFFVQGCTDKYIKKMVVLNIAAIEREKSRPVIKDTTNIEDWHNRVLKDSRDGKIYRIVKIGGQIWMAQNLAHKPDKGKYWRYTNDEEYLAEFGYLYKWKTAVKSDICPCGWRLPTTEDYEILLHHLGGQGLEAHERLIPTGDSGFNGLGSYCSRGFLTYFWTSEKGIAFTVGDKNPNQEHDATFRCALPSWGLPVRCIKDESKIDNY